MNFISKWWAGRQERKAFAALSDDALKAGLAIDIMLRDREWYGGYKVEFPEGRVPYVEVLILDEYPGQLSTFIPPRIGAIGVLVRLGSVPTEG